MIRTNWESRVAGTLGSADREFARHSADQERAWDLLAQLREEGVGLTSVTDEYRRILQAEGCLPDRIDQQIQRVARSFGPWLRD